MSRTLLEVGDKTVYAVVQTSGAGQFETVNAVYKKAVAATQHVYDAPNLGIEQSHLRVVPLVVLDEYVPSQHDMG